MDLLIHRSVPLPLCYNLVFETLVLRQTGNVLSIKKIFHTEQAERLQNILEFLKMH